MPLALLTKGLRTMLLTLDSFTPTSRSAYFFTAISNDRLDWIVRTYLYGTNVKGFTNIQSRAKDWHILLVLPIPKMCQSLAHESCDTNVSYVTRLITRFLKPWKTQNTSYASTEHPLMVFRNGTKIIPMLKAHLTLDGTLDTTRYNHHIKNIESGISQRDTLACEHH